MSRKKRRLKPVPVIITAIAFLAIIISVIIGVKMSIKKNKSDNKANVSISKTDWEAESVSVKEGENQITLPSKTEVEILFEDTAAPIGASFKVTALVIPDDNQNGLIFTSSDGDIFTVTKEGVVTIKGVGTATLTATVGNVSDAVLIEGIATVSSGSANDLPVYTENTNPSGNENASGSANSSGNENASVSVDSSGNANSSGSTNVSGSTNASGSANASGSVGSQEEISEVIKGNGFSQTLSNVYVAQENGTYYGEIITQNNVTIFYIKQRSATFDARIQTVIENILPGNSSTVWNNYLSASTDRTFTVDSRTVRIVVATGGGHSQIVIYN